MNPTENQIDTEDPTVIEEDPAIELLDELFDRVSKLESKHGAVNFTLHRPDDKIERLKRQVDSDPLRFPLARKSPASVWEKLYRSIALSAGIVLVGCIVAADISVDAKQRGELSTIALGSSFVAGWSVLMWGVAEANKNEGDR